METLLPFLEWASAQNCMQVLIWNVPTDRIIYAVDERHVAGYDASLYLAKNGVDFSESNMHPHFLTAILMMQQQALEYMFANRSDINKIVTNFDALYKKNNGDYMHFL